MVLPTEWTYGDDTWPDQPTSICTPSLYRDTENPDRQSCTSFLYDPAGGQWTSKTESGWTGASPAEATYEEHTTTHDPRREHSLFVAC